MSQDQLGLFDTPPNRQQVRFSLFIVGLLFVALLLILPVRDVRLPQIDAFIPMIDAIMFLGELITATLLYAQADVFRSRALTVLASGYVFAALLLVPHALTFPGAFAPDGLLDAGINTTGWIANLQRAAFPIAIILYVQLKRADTVSTAWNRTTGGEDHDGAVCGHRPGSRGDDADNTADTTGSRRSSSVVRRHLFPRGRDPIRHVRAFHRRDRHAVPDAQLGARHVAAGCPLELADPVGADHDAPQPIHGRLVWPVRACRCSPNSS